MGFGPCMCGADDCPRCNPGCDRVVECERCKEEFRLWDLSEEGYCETCEREIEAEKAAERAEAENEEEQETPNAKP